MYYFSKVQREHLLLKKSLKFSLILLALKLISIRMMHLLPILSISEPMKSLRNAIASITPASTVNLGANSFTSVRFSWSKDILAIFIKIILRYTALLVVVICILKKRKIKKKNFLRKIPKLSTQNIENAVDQLDRSYLCYVETYIIT